MLAVAVALSVASLINPGLGLDMSAVENVKTTIDSSATNTDLSLVDTNFKYYSYQSNCFFSEWRDAANYCFCFDCRYYFSKIKR